MLANPKERELQCGGWSSCVGFVPTCSPFRASDSANHSHGDRVESPSRWWSHFFAISCGVMAGKRKSVERLWREFFSNPSQWWDHRLEKANERYPDFKHKTQEALCFNGKYKPPWVEAKLAAMLSGTVQPYNFPFNKRLASYFKAGQYKKTMQLF